MPAHIEADDKHYVSNNPLDPFDPGEFEDTKEASINDETTDNASHDAQWPINQPKDSAPTFLSRLEQLPEIRSLPWRPGQELPPERSSESSRVQQRGACLLAARGVVNDKPCDHCASGLGRFTQCITLGNWFQGACSSCIFTSKGNRCSYRLQRGQVDGRRARHQLAEEGGMVEERKPGSRKRKRLAAVKDTTVQRVSNSTPGQDPLWLNGTSTQNSAHPSVAVVSPQAASPDMDSMLQAEIAEEQSTDFVHEAEEKQKRQHVERPSPSMLHDGASLSSKSHPSLKPAPSFSFQPVNRVIRISSDPSNVGPLPPPPLGEDHHIQSQSPKGTGEDGDNQINGGQQVPLIDTLPKWKQRQIFGLISGLQGGIDHLQKQLNLLQVSLGIEVEESNAKRTG